MRFQCPFCFSLINQEGVPQGTSVACPSCRKRAAVPASRFDSGCVINDFVIDSLIARGGMSSVYLARQLSMDRMVALKILRPDYLTQPTFVTSFLKEAKSAARLNHPNLIQALAVGEEDGALFYAMEYVKGETFAHRLQREKTVEPEQALNVIQQSAEALHAAWTLEGLIHRDIKPENIMLAEDGYAKIMDLGIAVSRYDQTITEISGTPAFMAPEQFSRRPLDCRTDIYALGATLFNALVGYPPFEGSTVTEIVNKHLHEAVAFPTDDLLPLPLRIKRLVLRMLAKNPDERFHDYEELLAEVVSIRRRLAPDDSMVPSVHTISFSKYKLRSGSQESPSEVFRRRTDRKRKIAMAKQQQPVRPLTQANQTARSVEPEPAPAPVVVRSPIQRLLVWVVLLLLLASCTLAIWLWVQHKSRMSPFVLQVDQFISERERAAVREAGDASALDHVIDEGRRLVQIVPDNPSSQEQQAYQILQAQLEILGRRVLALREQDLEGRVAQWRAQMQKQQLDQSAASGALESLEVTQDLLDHRIAEVNARSRQLAERERQLAALEQQVARNRNEVKELRAAAQQPLAALLFLRVVDLVRDHQFAAAYSALEDRPDDVPEWQPWKARLRAQVKDAEGVVTAVSNLGGRAKGADFSRGRLVAVKSTVRYFANENGQEVQHEIPLTALDQRELWSLVALVEPPLDERDRHHLNLALCYGDFVSAANLAPPKSASELKDFVGECFAWQLEELRWFASTGQKAVARAFAYKLKARYEGVPGLDRVEPQLVEILKGAAIAIPTADPTPAPAPAP